MPGRKTQRRRALVLGRTKLAEQDLIVTLLSVEGEQLRAVAKGGRKPGSRLAARTELFCDCDLLLSYGRGLPLITESQLIDTHAGLRRDVEAVSCASALAEVARLTCFENVRDAFLHPVLSRALQAVEQARDRAQRDLVVAAYDFKVLSHGGWRPDLDGCVACGEMPAQRFSTVAGGLLCESCARDVSGAEPISEGHVLWLRALIGSTFDTLLSSNVDAKTARYLMALAHSWCATHLETRLLATEFYMGI